MPDKKLNDNEIIKALECCSVGTFACDEQCPCFHSKSNLKINSCRFELICDALDLTTRQQEEIEALVAGQETLQKYIAKAKAEAIKEFAERLKEKSFQSFGNYGITRDVVEVCDIDNLIKEMVGEDDA